jgi:hypothetical protein
VRQCDGDVADDSDGSRDMTRIDPETARRNIVRAYEKQLAEGVDALTAAIDKVRASKTTAVKVEPDQASKPTLADLSRESAQERD